jgi:hypothetical protein
LNSSDSFFSWFFWSGAEVRLLGLISERDLVNTVIEVGYSDEQIACRQYPLSLGF